MRDLAVIMTNAPEPPTHGQVVFVACTLAFVVLFAVAFFTALGVARRLDRRGQVPAPPEPITDYPQPVGVSS